MSDDVPLMSLLSQALVAYTIEVDNEMERRMPHFTMKYGSITPGAGSPWLVSLVMWSNFLRFVGPGMISVREVVRRTGMPQPLVSSCIAGMVRWGHVVHHAEPNDSRPKPPKGDWVLNATTHGKRWHEAYPVVLAEVEAGWVERHGAASIDALRDALCAALDGAPSALPQYLPIVTGDLRTSLPNPDPPEEASGLAALLSRVLLRHTIDVEPSLPVALPVSANVLRVIGDDGVLVRDLPQRSGTAKQAVTTMVGMLERTGCAEVVPDGDAPRAKRIHLTDAGRRAQSAYAGAVASVDDAALRRALEPLDLQAAPLFERGGWRAKVKTPDTLPHHPVVMGHGGYPDGS